MKKFLFMVVAAMALFMTSCGVHQEATLNYNQLQTQVVLSQANYDVVGSATGECTQVYILGIGGLSKKSMSESAMSEMYQTANLSGSRAVINANVQYKVASYWGIYSKITAIANGTIIEFKK